MITSVLNILYHRKSVTYLYSNFVLYKNQYACFVQWFSEALPGVLGNRGKRVFISGEQRSNFEGNREQRQYWGTGNIGKQIFDFWGTGEQANLFQGNKRTGTPLGGPL